MLSTQEVLMIFARHEKCLVETPGHKTDATYVVSRNGTYETACGNHLTAAIKQLRARHPDRDKLNISVTVWSKP